MKNRFLISLIFFFLTRSFFAQNYFLSKDCYKDSLQFDIAIRKLSNDLLNNIKKDTKIQYFDDISMLQTLVGKYNESNKNIDTLLNLVSINKWYEGHVFNKEVYNLAKQIEINEHLPFNESYRKSFSMVYNKLPFYIIPEIDYGFDKCVKFEDVKNEFIELVDKRDNDSISLPDLKMVCKKYYNFVIYAQTNRLGSLMLKEKDAEMFDMQKNIILKLPNNAEVTALVIRKKGVKNPQPAIFTYNIYTGVGDYESAKSAAIYGYLGVTVNTRGKNLSKNDINPFEFDGEDAYYILDWISKHKWCNGKIGMVGGSYLGFSQWSATKKMHPALKTIVPQVSVGIGIDYPMSNNVFMGYMLQWIEHITINKGTDEVVFNDEKWEKLYSKWYKQGSPFRKLDSINGVENKIFQRWLNHPSFDNYWKNMIPNGEEYKNINIPILTTTGYFDDDQLGALYYFNEHYKYNPNANHYLVIGPYSHGTAQFVATKMYQNHKIDDVANISFVDLSFQWFDYIFKNKPKPELLKDKINYEVMGANRWEHTPSFQQMNENIFQLYLTNITDGEYYQLSTKKMIEEGFVNFTFDMKDRTQERPVEKVIYPENLSYKNNLKFISEPIGKSITVNGNFYGELVAELNKKDMDVFMELYELTSDGKYILLSDYLGRASYANDNSKRELLIPGQKNTIPFNRSYSFSKKIEKGSRLLLLLTLNRNQYWQINYGTGKDVSDEDINDAGEPFLIKWYNNSYIKIGYNNETAN